MNFAHAFWSKPLLNKKFNDFKTSLSITLVDYATSVMSIKRNGYKITLYTDKIGAELLADIPYDDVVIIDNTITDNYHFAASIKFCALEKMPLGDILVDGDAFFNKGKVYGIIESCKSDFLCSMYEDKNFIHNSVTNSKELTDIMKKVNFEKGYEIPDFDKLNGWYNTSTMKFNNAELKQKYIDMYKHNIKLCENLQYDKAWPDLYLEQYHLTQLLNLNGYTVETITPGLDEQSNQHSINIGFIHLGAAKIAIHNKLIQELYEKDRDFVLKMDSSITKLIKKYSN